MAFYKIEWKKSAIKDIKKIDKIFIAKIINAIENLQNNPTPKDCKKIKGSKYQYRIRVGNYRIIYSFENKLLIIKIIRIGHRKQIYKNI
ncbi:MAG: type II toxin-antitoxin system mRNA interferase toxin, RelE/StbE family [Spirochaetia bacterium]|nr:type II toxin-antitoxin system mRNA interferase toxin, RelE/StbE family [Spirochaetia bacterium]